MILLLSDLHGRFEDVNRQIVRAEQRRGMPVAAVIVLGDMGLFEPGLKRFFRRRGERFARPLYYIEGNHEDFDHLDTLIAAYADVMTHLPRGTVHTIAGRRFLALGGAAYMNAHTTQMGAVIGERDLQRCFQHPPDGVDIILSHDCPAGLSLPVMPGFEGLPPPGFAGGAALAFHFRPRFWFFGHHHQCFQQLEGDTAYYGLPQSAAGFGLLTPDDGFAFEDHRLPRERRPWWRWPA